LEAGLPAITERCRVCYFPWHDVHEQQYSSALLEALKTAAGLTKPYTFHALRHVAASLFIEQGWTPKKVQEVMGNQSIRMTYDTYGHLWDDKKGDREAVAQIQARLLG
jgi:integrase